MSYEEKLNEFLGLPNTEKINLDTIKKSKILFVRGQDEISIWNTKCKGRQITAYEMLKYFGISAIEEVFVNGSYIVTESSDEPSNTFKNRLKALGWNKAKAIKYLGISENEYNNLLSTEARNPISLLDRVYKGIGLNEIYISKKSTAKENFALRYKEIPNTYFNKENSEEDLLNFAWSIDKQAELKRSNIGKDNLKY